MKKVVYILGAGFSAPLNIPVMDNFLERAKDIFVENPQRYANFKLVFDIMRTIGHVKTYAKLDTLNIEQVFSFIEMSKEVGSSGYSDVNMSDFIVQVITKTTPVFQRSSTSRGVLFPIDYTYKYYVHFAAGLLGLRVTKPVSGYWQGGFDSQPAIKYGVITLNYDLVLENCLDFINESVHLDTTVAINREKETNSQGILAYAKLHGSVKDESVIPPTWNKVAFPRAIPAWKLAYKCLSEANEIRIVGYSLPDTDSYVRYLLLAGLLDNQNLKTIDVITMDDELQTTKSRYAQFFEGRRWRFYNNDIFPLLSAIDHNSFDLESAHLKLINGKLASRVE